MGHAASTGWAAAQPGLNVHCAGVSVQGMSECVWSMESVPDGGCAWGMGQVVSVDRVCTGQVSVHVVWDEYLGCGVSVRGRG